MPRRGSFQTVQGAALRLRYRNHHWRRLIGSIRASPCSPTPLSLGPPKMLIFPANNVFMFVRLRLTGLRRFLRQSTKERLLFWDLEIEGMTDLSANKLDIRPNYRHDHMLGERKESRPPNITTSHHETKSRFTPRPRTSCVPMLADYLRHYSRRTVVEFHYSSALPFTFSRAVGNRMGLAGSGRCQIYPLFPFWVTCR
jgi:hypothetical protein